MTVAPWIETGGMQHEWRCRACGKAHGASVSACICPESIALLEAGQP